MMLYRSRPCMDSAIFIPPSAVRIIFWNTPKSILRRASSSLSGVTSRYFPPVTRSAKAERVPGTSLMAASISRATRPMTLRSSPAILIPMGVRTPVEIISIRILIG